MDSHGAIYVLKIQFKVFLESIEGLEVEGIAGLRQRIDTGRGG